MGLFEELARGVYQNPIRGARTTLSSLNNLRQVLGEALIGPQLMTDLGPVSQGVVPFFGGGLSGALSEGIHPGIAARPPQGLVEIPMTRAPGLGIERHREPFLHIPDRNMTIIPKEKPFLQDRATYEQGLGHPLSPHAGAYAHGDLAASYAEWMRAKGFHDTGPRVEWLEGREPIDIPDLWHGGKNAPIQGEARHATYHQANDELGEMATMRPLPHPQVNLFTTQRQTPANLLLHLAERYPKSKIVADEGEFSPPQIRQAKKKATRTPQKRSSSYASRRRSGR